MSHDAICGKLIGYLQKIFTGDDVEYIDSKFSSITFSSKPSRLLFVKSDIRSDGVDHAWLNDVVNAIRELHDQFNITHLDIRLPNICYLQNFTPVLIDTDRSVDGRERRINRFPVVIRYKADTISFQAVTRIDDKWALIGLFFLNYSLSLIPLADNNIKK